MKTTHILLAAIVAATLSSASLAAPLIQFVDNLDDTVTLQVVVDDSGSIGAELAVAVETSPGLTLTDVAVNTAVFDTANPGDNPFIPGSPAGGDTMGLYTDYLSGEIFAAYGSSPVSPGAYDYFTLSYEGAGTLDAFGVVAQQAVLYSGLTASIDVGGSTGSGLPQIQFVDNGDGTVTLQIVTSQIGSTGSELAIAVQVGDTLSIDGAYIADTLLFDTPNPGSNPFTGTITNGLYTDFAENQVFASFGSDILGVGAFDFLTFDVSGAGTLTAGGLVAQQGQLNDGLAISIELVPEPTTALLAGCGLLFAGARRRV